jgi:ferric-dicitrate binding protein FerR (iron transport regulator)
VTTRDRFGARLDAALGENPPEAALRVQRANVLAAIRRERRPRGRPRWELAVGAAMAAALGLALALWPAQPSPLVASWRGGSVVRAALLVSEKARAEPIDFSDGSRVLLDPEASARVLSLEPNHAELALKNGKLAASVRHREGVRWTIVAGPYEVRVVGTKFTVAWDQSSQNFHVEVSEGRVQVTGGDLGTRAVQLDPGQHLHRGGTAPVAGPAPSASSASNALQPSAAPLASVGSIEAESARSHSIKTVPPARDSVGALALAGKYREALALAEQEGFERVIVELPEGELLALGNAARYAGSPGRARQALAALRNRFPGRPAAGLAALYLAKLAEQVDKNSTEAARWLRIFLSESPTGDLAADARASLLSILLSSGDTAGATAVARDYLRYHPNGPIADRARVLVSRSEGK